VTKLVRVDLVLRKPCWEDFNLDLKNENLGKLV
jgi:hypothetical protein